MSSKRTKKTCPELRRRVFVAMSGGVDSSVAAALLKEREFDVRGIHMKMWSDPSIPCTTKEDRYDAMRVAAHLEIPFETWDFTEEYKREVVDYMIREYAAGKTPNPDVMCNRKIKFGVFLKKALEQGADFVATGHYVRLSTNNESNTNKRINESPRIRKFVNSEKIRYSLMAARDKNKDQSYFLWTLAQEQLKYCIFPIGEYVKPEVRELARKFGLPTAEKPDSQGVCFIGEFNMREFLKNYIPVERGPVLTASGKAVGEHQGLAFHTIGQREGLGIGGGIPYYVAAKDFSRNALVVAEGPYDQSVFKNELVAADIHWISGTTPKFPLKCEARIRYRQPLQRTRIMEYELRSRENSVEKSSSIIHNSSFLIQFEEPQRAVTPGQSVVFYKGEEMIGGGVIQG